MKERLSNIRIVCMWTDIRPGAEVLGTHVLEYIFEILVLIEIMVMYSYSCSMYSDFTSTLVLFQYDVVKII